MLRKLTLEGVGPAKRLKAEFADRLNLITGDNGLGKSFLLDVAWWALTGTWSLSGQALPRSDARKAAISYTVLSKGNKPLNREVRFDFKKHSWPLTSGSSLVPGLVIHAHVNGGFSVWDPARNERGIDESDRPSAFLFRSSQVWEGLVEDGRSRCEGLYRDWASWQRENNESFRQLQKAIEALSPPDGPLRHGELLRIGPDNAQDYPSIRMPYGVDVPVIHASAGIRRILALAYLLIWTWREHLKAAAQRREKPVARIVFLVDEIEAHLHPAWQRRVLPSLLDSIAALGAPLEKATVQVVATTHSPLVCVSLEPIFDPDADRLFALDIDAAGKVTLETVPFHKRGTSENWLASPMFDIGSTYSEPAAEAIATASRLVEAELKNPGTVKKPQFQACDTELRTLLRDIDPFWVTWRRIATNRNWLP